MAVLILTAIAYQHLLLLNITPPADDEDIRKIQTVCPIQSHICPYNPCTLEDVDECYPGHGDFMIEMMNSLDPY